MAFQIGDVVQLKSGGAAMTVSGDDGMGGVGCVWHNPLPKGGFEAKSQAYPPEVLELKSDADKRYMDALTGAAQRR